MKIPLCSSNWSIVLESVVIVASNFSKSIIINNSLSKVDMPPVLQISLNASEDCSVTEELISMRNNLLSAALEELAQCIELLLIPTKEELVCCSMSLPQHWNILSSFKKGALQSDASFKEQQHAIRCFVEAIDSYLNPPLKRYFHKGYCYFWCSWERKIIFN